MRCVGAIGMSRLLGFFFSSRRRHTRLQGDWSSDVCSSDLSPPQRSLPPPSLPTQPPRLHLQTTRTRSHRCTPERSEERRVGKECRSRWSPEHSKKKKSHISNTLLNLQHKRKMR